MTPWVGYRKIRAPSRAMVLAGSDSSSNFDMLYDMDFRLTAVAGCWVHFLYLYKDAAVLISGSRCLSMTKAGSLGCTFTTTIGGQLRFPNAVPEHCSIAINSGESARSRVNAILS